MNSLTKALNQIKKYCYAKSTLPVLQNVLLELEDGNLKLTATNLDAAASVVIPNAGKPFATTVNLKKLVSVVKNMTDSISFEITTKEEMQWNSSWNPDTNSMEKEEAVCIITKLVVSDYDTSATLATINADEFPVIAKKGKLLGEIDLTGIERVYPFATSCRNGRITLECVLFQLHSGVTVAADGFKLATMVGDSVDTEETNLLIRADALVKLPKHAKKASLFSGEGAATLEFDAGFTLTVQVPSGNFPDYQQIIPKHHNSEFTVNVKKWLKAVQGVKVFADDTDGITRHSITGNTMTVSAKDEDGNVIQKELPATQSGVYPMFALENGHLTTTLKACVSSEITVKLTMDESDPGTLYEPTFKPVVFEDGNWLACVMPMHTKRW